MAAGRQSGVRRLLWSGPVNLTAHGALRRSAAKNREHGGPLDRVIRHLQKGLNREHPSRTAGRAGLERRADDRGTSGMTTGERFDHRFPHRGLDKCTLLSQIVESAIEGEPPVGARPISHHQQARKRQGVTRDARQRAFEGLLGGRGVVLPQTNSRDRTPRVGADLTCVDVWCLLEGQLSIRTPGGRSSRRHASSARALAGNAVPRYRSAIPAAADLGRVCRLPAPVRLRRRLRVPHEPSQTANGRRQSLAEASALVGQPATARRPSSHMPVAGDGASSRSRG